jgi:PRTRC genetic system ThiF family protein
MITEHTLPKPLCRRGQPLRVLVVGAGGNGSAVLLGLPYLHQAMKVWGHAGGIHVMLVDGDQVSKTNCVRQPFASADVGLNKAVVLINRVNLFWGLRWQAHPEHFHKDSLRTNSAGPHLIIGCVDTLSRASWSSPEPGSSQLSGQNEKPGPGLCGLSLRPTDSCLAQPTRQPLLPRGDD